MTLTRTPGYYLEDGVIYPESDGERMAENTEQFDWIALIKEGVAGVFENDPNVFVAGDLLWYPVQGRNRVVTAPDTMVAFGRPQGRRGSYLQWLEDDIAPQVVFEVLSPSNSEAEMQAKHAWYERYGVEEYYIYDPDRAILTGYLRRGERLEPLPDLNGWISPRLSVRFEMTTELHLYEPDGTPFISKLQERRQRRQAEEMAQQVQLRIIREQEQRHEAELCLEQERQRAEQERQRAERLEALLRENGISFDKE